MKQGKLNLEYQEQSDTILFKCKDTGTEYHHSSLDFEFVRGEIDKKNNSVADSEVLTYDYCRSLGFCEHGIKDFCDKLGIDIGGTFTRKELVKACRENEEALFLLKMDYPSEINKLIGDIKFSDKVFDSLKTDISEWVRAEVAKYGYALEELKSDADWYVREEVATQGYALDQLKGDENIFVRQAVARQGYALDDFKSDENIIIRIIVVEQGHALDELKDDNNWCVRLEVAKQGYALEQLKNDEHWSVRNAANNYKK